MTPRESFMISPVVRGLVQNGKGAKKLFHEYKADDQMVKRQGRKRQPVVHGRVYPVPEPADAAHQKDNIVGEGKAAPQKGGKAFRIEGPAPRVEQNPPP